MNIFGDRRGHDKDAANVLAPCYACARVTHIGACLHGRLHTYAHTRALTQSKKPPGALFLSIKLRGVEQHGIEAAGPVCRPAPLLPPMVGRAPPPLAAGGEQVSMSFDCCSSTSVSFDASCDGASEDGSFRVHYLSMDNVSEYVAATVPQTDHDEVNSVLECPSGSTNGSPVRRVSRSSGSPSLTVTQMPPLSTAHTTQGTELYSPSVVMSEDGEELTPHPTTNSPPPSPPQSAHLYPTVDFEQLPRSHSPRSSAAHAAHAAPATPAAAYEPNYDAIGYEANYTEAATTPISITLPSIAPLPVAIPTDPLLPLHVASKTTAYAPNYVDAPVEVPFVGDTAAVSDTVGAKEGAPGERDPTNQHLNQVRAPHSLLAASSSSDAACGVPGVPTTPGGTHPALVRARAAMAAVTPDCPAPYTDLTPLKTTVASAAASFASESFAFTSSANGTSTSHAPSPSHATTSVPIQAAAAPAAPVEVAALCAPADEYDDPAKCVRDRASCTPAVADDDAGASTCQSRANSVVRSIPLTDLDVGDHCIEVPPEGSVSVEPLPALAVSAEPPPAPATPAARRDIWPWVAPRRTTAEQVRLPPCVGWLDTTRPLAWRVCNLPNGARSLRVSISPAGRPVPRRCKRPMMVWLPMRGRIVTLSSVSLAFTSRRLGAKCLIAPPGPLSNRHPEPARMTRGSKRQALPKC